MPSILPKSDGSLPSPKLEAKRKDHNIEKASKMKAQRAITSFIKKSPGKAAPVAKVSSEQRIDDDLYVIEPVDKIDLTLGEREDEAATASSSHTLPGIESLSCKSVCTEVDYYARFLQPQLANRFYKEILENLPWGDTSSGKRQSIVYGEPGLYYEYSGETHYATPWTSQGLGMLLELKQLVESVTVPHTFNFVLVNYYPDGRSAIAPHADAEAGLAVGVPIASVSLGAERDFVLQPKVDEADATAASSVVSKQKLSIKLAHGSLCIMHAECQKKWKHSVPPRMSEKSGRINLTFRQITTGGHVGPTYNKYKMS